MEQKKWQLNPSMSIQNYTEQKRLQISQMSPHAVEIFENYNELTKLFNVLKLKNKFDESELLQLAIENGFNGQDLFQDLKSLNLIIENFDKINQYSRHQLYYQYAGLNFSAQENLLNKTVTLIGVGGIGTSCATLLNAAGIGKIILADSDLVELSNLTRTTLFDLSDINKRKALAAKEKLEARSKKTHVETLEVMLSRDSYEEYEVIFQQSDIVILSGDSGKEVHQIAYQLSKKWNKPILNAGYIETNGIVGPITIGRHSKREYELEATQSYEEINSNLMAPSYGPLNSLVSSIAVNEVIRYLLNIETVTMNCRLVINSFNYQIQKEEWL